MLGNASSVCILSIARMWKNVRGLLQGGSTIQIHRYLAWLTGQGLTASTETALSDWNGSGWKSFCTTNSREDLFHKRLYLDFGNFIISRLEFFNTYSSRAHKLRLTDAPRFNERPLLYQPTGQPRTDNYFSECLMLRHQAQIRVTFQATLSRLCDLYTLWVPALHR